MARLNQVPSTLRTYEGAPAKSINAPAMLRRSVLACMLWEDTFYEDGVYISDRIKSLVPKVDPATVALLAEEARSKYKLRHVPLLLVREMARLKTHRHLVSRTLENVVQRADELTEFMAIYWKEGRCPISGQVKKGLAETFHNFTAYDLAKYDRDTPVKLKDVMFMCHPKPRDFSEELLWRQLVDGTLPIPNTWEVRMSALKNATNVEKRGLWEELLQTKSLGALALLRNLRNMQQVGVNDDLIIDAIKNMRVERVLPFRFITSARYAPNYESYLEEAMFKCLDGFEKLPGTTELLVDVSGSMDDHVSAKSDMTRLEAACGVAILARELCERARVSTFSNELVAIPDRRGFALRDAIVESQSHLGTYMGKSVETINHRPYDRLIVFTDEQSHDRVPAPKGKGYVVNVASNRYGVGYGPWTHIDGFSEAIFSFICEIEK